MIQYRKIHTNEIRHEYVFDENHIKNILINHLVSTGLLNEDTIVNDISNKAMFLEVHNEHGLYTLTWTDRLPIKEQYHGM